MTNMMKKKEIPCIGWKETFDATLDIFALISKDFEILKLNQAGYNSLGKKPIDIIGKKCYEIVHGLDAPIDGCPCSKALKTKIGSSGEVADHGRHYLATASPILDDKNNARAFTHTIIDITEQKMKEESFKKANDELESRVIERTTDLIKINGTLKIEVKEHLKDEKDLKES